MTRKTWWPWALEEPACIETPAPDHEKWEEKVRGGGPGRREEALQVVP